MTPPPEPRELHPSGRAVPVIQQLATRTVYRNPWMTVREDQIRRPDGSHGVYGVLDKPDFALVIPADRGGFWEFPQGHFPQGQDGDPAELARSELEEETGLRAGRLEHLARLHVAYGMSSQGCNVFLATALEHGPARREQEEQDMRQQWVTRGAFDFFFNDTATTEIYTI